MGSAVYLQSPPPPSRERGDLAVGSGRKPTFKAAPHKGPTISPECGHPNHLIPGGDWPAT